MSLGEDYAQAKLSITVEVIAAESGFGKHGDRSSVHLASEFFFFEDIAWREVACVIQNSGRDTLGVRPTYSARLFND